MNSLTLSSTSTIATQGIYNIRGAFALTQGEESIEQALVLNINELKSKTRGFNKTRSEVLETMDKKDFTTWVKTCMEMDGIPNKLTTGILKSVTEKCVRDHCTDQMADTFRKCIIQRYKALGSIEAVVNSLLGYFQCGKLVPVAQTYRECKEELKKGEIVYYEPNC